MGNLSASYGIGLPVSSVPNIFGPTFATMSASSNLALNQRCRRSAILAQTRRLIDRTGIIEEVTVRAIASECRVSVQTLYNLFGSRTRILELAITDQMRWMARHAEGLDAYPNPVLAFSDLNCDFIVNWPDFMRSTALACAPVSGDLYRAIRKSNNECILTLLQTMRNRRQLRDEVSVGSLASLLNFICQMTPLEWATGHCNIRELRFEVAARNVCALSNAATQAHASIMHQWLDKVRNSI